MQMKGEKVRCTFPHGDTVIFVVIVIDKDWWRTFPDLGVSCPPVMNKINMLT